MFFVQLFFWHIALLSIYIFSIFYIQDIVQQGDDHTKAKGFVAKTSTEDGQERTSFNVNGNVH
jgi:hypothetical protein